MNDGPYFVATETGQLGDPVVPDEDGETSTLTVAGPAHARVVDVGVRIELTYALIDDLDFVLVAPDGQAANLVSDVGGLTSVDGQLTIGTFGTGLDRALFADGSIKPAGGSGAPTDFDTTAGDDDAFPRAAPAFSTTSPATTSRARGRSTPTTTPDRQRRLREQVETSISYGSMPRPARRRSS